MFVAKEFEYVVERLANASAAMEDHMNRMARDGWDVVAVTFDGHDMLVTYKRERS